MDALTIITILSTAIIAPAAASFSKVYFEKVFATYNPDIKRHISFLKKSFAFSFSYLLPMSSVLYMMFWYETIDKYFVFSISINVCALFFSLILDMIRVLKHATKESVDLHVQSVGLIKDISASDKRTQEYVSRLIKVVETNQVLMNDLAVLLTRR